MTEIKNVKALAFDAYGTLFDVYSVTGLCEKLFPGRGDALAKLWRQKQLQYSLLRSLMERHKDFWQVTEDALVHSLKSLQLDSTGNERESLMNAWLELALFPDVKPGLEALKKKGLKLSILSNGAPKMLEATAANSGIAALLDGIISIEQAGIYKPSPRVYELGPLRMGASNKELGFVSANSWDINGAASAGLVTFWIQRSPAEPPEELGYSADRIVTSVSDLVDLL